MGDVAAHRSVSVFVVAFFDKTMRKVKPGASSTNTQTDPTSIKTCSNKEVEKVSGDLESSGSPPERFWNLKVTSNTRLECVCLICVVISDSFWPSN